MKKSHKRLLIFEIALFIILIINSFVSNILSGYNMLILLLVCIIVFKFVMGFEKDKHRFTKDIIFNLLIILLLYFIIYYVFGIVTGFVKTSNYYNIYGLKTFILPIILIILLKEFLRYNILQKAENSKLLNILTISLFIFLDISTLLYSTNLKVSYDVFMFIALTLLPAISNNILATYISLKVGYKPVMLYFLIMSLYSYLVPIIPDFSEYIISIINLIFPLIVLFIIYNLFEKVYPKKVFRVDKKLYILPCVFSTILVMIVVYFTSGYFHYFAIVVGSGSMIPNINVGDVVVVEKVTSSEIKDLKKGQVLVYRHNKIMIVHRIVDILEKNGKLYFYTKGDNNNTKDNYVVTEKEIVGVSSYKIPLIGYPTVWLNRL